MKPIIPAFAFVLTGGGLLTFDHQDRAISKPNILIIYADDLGYGDLGSFGGDIPTPNIDGIGRGGIRFTDFYVSAPACTPSRYSLFTGSYPQRSMHGLTQALMPENENKHYLDAAETTIAEYLKQNGYKTSLFGKWHLGSKDPNDGPQNHGFDEFAGFKGGCIDYFTHVYGKMGHDWYVGKKETREEGYSTDLITRHALDFIDRAGGEGEPFFTFLAYNAPHYGKTNPDSLVGCTVALSEGKYHGYEVINSLQAPPEYVRRFEHISDPYRRVYAAMVSCLDDNIGRILKKLEEKKLLGNTIIWFISDNGGYSERYYGHADNGGLRGEKGTLWEGGIRVPAMLQWKEKIAGGKEINTPVCNIDILPTLLAILNIPLQEERKVIDGVDISPVVFSHKTLKRSLAWKFGGQTAIREGNWKLVNGKHLFDLKADPYESRDVSEEHPELVDCINSTYKEIEQKISGQEDKRLSFPGSASATSGR